MLYPSCSLRLRGGAGRADKRPARASSGTGSAKNNHKAAASEPIHMRDADSSDSSEYVPTDKEEEDDDIADDLAPHLVPHLARDAVSYAATTARCDAQPPPA
jgi:hypothetical protein